MVKFQVELDIASKISITMNNQIKIDEARWCWFSTGEVISLELYLLLSRHCHQATEYATTLHWGL